MRRLRVLDTSLVLLTLALTTLHPASASTPGQSTDTWSSYDAWASPTFNTKAENLARRLPLRALRPLRPTAPPPREGETEGRLTGRADTPLASFQYTGAMRTWIAPEDGFYRFHIAGVGGGRVGNHGSAGVVLDATYLMVEGAVVEIFVGEQPPPPSPFTLDPKSELGRGLVTALESAPTTDTLKAVSTSNHSDILWRLSAAETAASGATGERAGKPDTTTATNGLSFPLGGGSGGGGATHVFAAPSIGSDPASWVLLLSAGGGGGMTFLDTKSPTTDGTIILTGSGSAGSGIQAGQGGASGQGGQGGGVSLVSGGGGGGIGGDGLPLNEVTPSGGQGGRGFSNGFAGGAAGVGGGRGGYGGGGGGSLLGGGGGGGYSGGGGGGLGGAGGGGGSYPEAGVFGEVQSAAENRAHGFIQIYAVDDPTGGV